MRSSLYDLSNVGVDDYFTYKPSVSSLLRPCTEEDFINVNAGHIWREKFPDGNSDNTLICDDNHSLL